MTPQAQVDLKREHGARRLTANVVETRQVVAMDDERPAAVAEPRGVGVGETAPRTIATDRSPIAADEAAHEPAVGRGVDVATRG